MARVAVLGGCIAFVLSGSDLGGTVTGSLFTGMS